MEIFITKFFIYFELQLHATFNQELILLMSLMTKSMLKILGNVKNFARKIIYVFFGPTIAILLNVGFIQEMLSTILSSVLFVHEAQDFVKVSMYALHICLVQKKFFLHHEFSMLVDCIVMKFKLS